MDSLTAYAASSIASQVVVSIFILTSSVAIYKMSSPVSGLLIFLCLVLGLTVSLVWGQTPSEQYLKLNPIAYVYMYSPAF